MIILILGLEPRYEERLGKINLLDQCNLNAAVSEK